MATVAGTSLDARERRALERAVEGLRRGLGDDLRAVWLFGSRARGEPPGPDSDIDLMVITAARERDESAARRLVEEALQVERPRATLSVHVGDPGFIAEQRAIDSFFMRELDRDKVVLWGSDGGEMGPRVPVRRRERADGDLRVSPRSEQFLRLAHEFLTGARGAFEAGSPSAAASSAYCAMFNAARAALSEEDRYARTHKGTWHLFRETFVTSGRFDAELAAGAQAAQPVRENADYHGIAPDRAEAAEIVDRAERLVRSVEQLVGA